MSAPKGNKFAKGGKRTGAGRKKLGVRALCAQMFEDRLPILGSIADDVEEKASDRIAAIKELARVGIGDKMEIAGADGGKAIIEVIYRNRKIANDSDPS